MAARKLRGTKDAPWSEDHRKRIQTTMLIKRLEDHALGNVQMETTQVRAIEILLKKSVPDLSAITLSGDDNHPIKHEVSWLPSSE